MIDESIASCIGQTPMVYLRRLFPIMMLSRNWNF